VFTTTSGVKAYVAFSKGKTKLDQLSEVSNWTLPFKSVARATTTSMTRRTTPSSTSWLARWSDGHEGGPVVYVCRRIPFRNSTSLRRDHRAEV
jgi:hypothetical protein